MNNIKLLFGIHQRVIRRTYISWGFGLFFLKYLGEVFLYYLAKNTLLTPTNFISPFLYTRYPAFASLPDWFGPAIVLWSLPFIWIGVGMSIRRAADANLSPWLGILFFIPVVNYLLMLALALIPTSSLDSWNQRKQKLVEAKVMSPLILTIIFALCGTGVAWFSTNFLRIYATSLFVGSPLILGLVQGYFLNFKVSQGFRKTTLYIACTITLIHLFLLLFALEGLICLAMSLPISLTLGIIGSIFGTAIANYSKPSAVMPSVLILILPLMPLVESNVGEKTHRDMVLSIVEINASPEQIWPNVVKFSDLPPTKDWLFQLGVAYPVRAQITGTGVGALRRCEFSTGAFIEPITTWDEPQRLAFNVQYQPQPMKEISFYDHVDAPHLNSYFRSVRGEFLLIPTHDNKTRLEGRTWYEIDMQPGWYWQVYGRWFIHKIHMRVLAHIKNLSEKRGN